MEATGDNKRRAVILIVDDEQSVLAMLTEVLSDEGFVVERAKNGREALERVHAVSPDLVVTDLMMPIMDGRTLAQRIREHSSTENMPILLISAAYTQHADDLFSAVLGKPFALDELIDAVHSLLL